MRFPRSNEGDLKRGAWTPEEDRKLVDYIEKHGQGCWQLLPKKAGLNRCGKSCRLRWTNYLRPDIKRGNFSPHEEQTILDLHLVLGNKWSMIAARLPGRTDNEIKNYWNTHLKKRLIQYGIDPNTHQPITYPILPDYHSSPLENLAKLGIICSILQILKTNNNNNPLPMNRVEIETPLNESEQGKYPSHWHGAENQTVVFDSFEMIPKLEDGGALGSTSKSIINTPDESLPSHDESGFGDELEQMFNYKEEVFGSLESDIWGEVVENEGEEGSSSSSWRDVFSEFFPAL